MDQVQVAAGVVVIDEHEGRAGDAGMNAHSGRQPLHEGRLARTQIAVQRQHLAAACVTP